MIVNILNWVKIDWDMAMRNRGNGYIGGDETVVIGRRVIDLESGKVMDIKEEDWDSIDDRCKIDKDSCDKILKEKLVSFNNGSVIVSKKVNTINDIFINTESKPQILSKYKGKVSNSILGQSVMDIVVGVDKKNRLVHVDGYGRMYVVYGEDDGEYREQRKRYIELLEDEAVGRYVVDTKNKVLNYDDTYGISTISNEIKIEDLGIENIYERHKILGMQICLSSIGELLYTSNRMKNELLSDRGITYSRCNEYILLVEDLETIHNRNVIDRYTFLCNGVREIRVIGCGYVEHKAFMPSSIEKYADRLMRIKFKDCGYVEVENKSGVYSKITEIELVNVDEVRIDWKSMRGMRFDMFLRTKNVEQIKQLSKEVREHPEVSVRLILDESRLSEEQKKENRYEDAK